MGCLKSRHQYDITQTFVRFNNFDDETGGKSFKDVMIEADQENRKNIQTIYEVFERTLGVIGERGWDKRLIHDLLESNTKIVSIYLNEKYKAKIINHKSEIDRLQKCIEPLQHQLKTCLFFLDKDDFMTAAEGRNAEEEIANDDEFRLADDEIDENQLDPQYRNEQILGEEMDRLIEERHKIEEEKIALEMKLQELNENFDVNKTVIKELTLKKEETENRLKKVKKALDKTRKERNDLKDFLDKMNPFFKNRLINKMNFLQQKLLKAKQNKARIVQTIGTLHENYNAKLQSLNEDIKKSKLKWNDFSQIKIKTRS